jgi:hypothetical protein
MSVALGVQSRRQFARYGPGAAALAAVVVDEVPADAAAQWAVLSVRGGGRPIHGVATRLLMLSAQAHSHGGAGTPPVAPGWGGGSHHVHR